MESQKYVIEVTQHYPNGIYSHGWWCKDHSTCVNKDTGCLLKHIDFLGFIDKLFNTKEEAAEYYKKYFPTTRPPQDDGFNYTSEIHEDTKRSYGVVEYDNQIMKLKISLE
jgi:hypothetical protein